MNDALKRAAERLASALADENAALAAMDLGRATALLTEKTRATEGFLAAREGGAASGADAAVGERLTQLATENKRLLERAMAVQARILRLVADAAGASVANGGRYGANGAFAATRGRAFALVARA